MQRQTEFLCPQQSHFTRQVNTTNIYGAVYKEWVKVKHNYIIIM